MNTKLSNKTEGLITAIEYKRKSVAFSYWLMFGIIVVIAVICIFPIIWSFLSGFKEVDEFFSLTPTLFPQTFKIEKIQSVWRDLKLGRAFLNSMIMIIGCLIGNIVIGGLAGYTISRLKPRGSKILFTLMLWTMMMPNTLSLIPQYLTWIDFPVIHVNLKDTYIPFYIASMGSVFNILLFKNFFDKIPISFVESAKLDGCGNVGVFLRIIIPLSKPIVATISIFVFTGCWNDFLMPYLIIKKQSLMPVAVRLYSLMSQWTQPQQMLAAFIVMIPSLVVYMICSKQILGNSMSAGIKE